jgi:hypothetical protein
LATAPLETSTKPHAISFAERWFFTAMALAMLAVSIAGFMPAIMHPSARRAPLTLLAAAHGALFLAWLLLYLAQSLLVATRRVGWHKRLGLSSVLVLVLIIPTAYKTTMDMVRRGFDLSGDQRIDPRPQVAMGGLDASTGVVFNLVGLLLFAVLAVAALCYRRRPEIHKRLMLFANIELMGPPITHLIGHIPALALTPPAVLIPFLLFLLAAVARDYLVNKRIHQLTAILAIILFVALPIQGALIGPSAAWHHLVAWLAKN